MDFGSQAVQLLVGPAAAPSFPIAQTFVARSPHPGLLGVEVGETQFDLGVFLVPSCPTADNSNSPLEITHQLGHRQPRLPQAQ